MIKGLILSIQFLTRIPINISIDFNDENLSKSAFFFSLAGMTVGAIAGGVYYLFSFINTNIAAFLAILAIILATGGLHLDGLSDTCDGFFSARKRERILEIMKDSRVGTYGVVAIVLDILLKYVIISNMKGNIPVFLIFSCGNARLICSLIMSFAKTARPGGLGDTFAKSNPRKYALAGLVVYCIVNLIINPMFLIPIAFSFLSSLFVGLKTYKIIGGYTGDVYGASIEIAEIVSLLSFAGVSIWI